MVFRFFSGSATQKHARRLYAAIVAAARQEPLYARHRVPDTAEGRFECLALHVALLRMRLAVLGKPAQALSQNLIDTFFSDLDASLRELGTGDLAVPKKMKKLAEAYFGRSAAYEAMLAPGGAPALALARNILGSEARSAEAEPLAQYALALHSALSACDLDAILAFEGAGWAQGALDAAANHENTDARENTDAHHADDEENGR